jgi:hypothetical protein
MPALLGGAFDPVLVRLAVTLNFVHCGQLAAGLAPARMRRCRTRTTAAEAAVDTSDQDSGKDMPRTGVWRACSTT